MIILVIDNPFEYFNSTWNDTLQEWEMCCVF